MKTSFLSNKRAVLLCLVAILLSIVVYFRWIGYDFFLRSDHNYYSAEQLQNRFPTLWTTANSPGGHPVLNLWDAPLRIIQSIFGLMSFDSRIYDRIFLFFPIIILSPLLSFWLIYKITRNPIGALVGSLVFSYNTYYLSLIKVGHLGHVVAAILSVGAISLAISIKQSHGNNPLIKLILLLVAIFIYSIHIGYILLGALSLHTILRWHKLKKISLHFILTRSMWAVMIILLLLTFSWLPSLKTQSLTDNAILARPIIHQEHYTILKSLTIHHPFWNGTDTWFISYDTPAYLFSLVVLVLLSVLFSSSPYKIYFVILGLVGIFFGKLLSAPLGGVYQNLYNHFIGFSAFREPSKFFFLTTISYAVLVGLLVRYFQTKKTTLARVMFYTTIAIVTSLSLVNIFPILTGTIKGLYVPVQKPVVYDNVQQFLNKDSSYFRTITVPAESKWIESTTGKTKFDINQAMESKWHKRINYERFREYPFISILMQPFSDSLLDYYSVKYLIVPLDDLETKSIADFSVYFDKPRDYYVSLLDRLPYLRRINKANFGSIAVYENIGFSPYIRTLSDVNLDEQSNYLVIPNNIETLKKQTPVDFSTKRISDSAQSHIFQPFNTISSHEISRDSLTRNYTLNNDGYLYYDSNSLHLEKINNDIILTDAIDSNNNSSETYNETALQIQGEVAIKYTGSAMNNLIKNSSFEEISWTDEVKDCDNYDSNPIISMGIDRDQSTEGSSSLQLSAQRHDACTYIDIDIKQQARYLLSFDIKTTSEGKEMQYFYVSFNDPDKKYYTQSENISNENWTRIEKYFAVPKDATKIRLFLYARSDANSTSTNTVWYDNVHLHYIPDSLDNLWLREAPPEIYEHPENVLFDLINPTKKLVHIKGATTPFYLAMSESYHPQWQAQLSNGKIHGFFGSWIPWVKPDRISDDKHFELNGFLNGWFVEPEALCANGNTACTKNPDGSYDMEMTVEFFPQRWFYLGLLISGTTLAGCVGYLAYDFAKRRRRRLRKESLPTIPATNMIDYPRTEPVAKDSPKPVAPPTSLHTPQVVIKRPPRRKV